MRRVAALAAGVVLLVLGVASGIPELAMNGLSTEAIVGSVGALVGFALVLLAARALLRGRRRRVHLVAVAAAAVVIQWVVVPAVNAGLATHAPHGDAPTLAGARNITFAATDGVEIAAWFVPGAGHAAVVLLHGSHGSRADLVDHLRMLHRAGFAVLALDSRGHGASGGRTNALGWGTDQDLAAAVRYLRRAGYDRVAALGLSMGAEVALRAAGEGVPLTAVVADGAGASTSGDDRLLGRGALAPVVDSVTWLTMRGVAALSGVGEPRPLRDVVRGIRVPVLLIASNRSGERTIDAAYRARIGGRATLWYVPDAGHTKALAVHPRAYAARTTAFLGASLSVR